MFHRFAFAFVFIFFGASISIACTCSDLSVREKVRFTESVFTGELVSFKSLEQIFDGFYTDEAVFRVEKQWKGKKQSQITVLASFDSPGMCGDLPLNVGEKFLIYARKEKGKLVIQRDCPLSSPLSYAGNEIKKLNSFWYRLFAKTYPYPRF